MSPVEQLFGDHAGDFLRQAADKGLTGTLSCLHGGKWGVFDIRILAAGPDHIHLQLISETRPGLVFKKELPVGLCLQLEYDKYVFESVILEPPSGKDNRLAIEIPDQIEKMQRRVYARHAVPTGLNVRAMFWHRGYPEEVNNAPHEDYWQGKLENLSAGGAMICVDRDIRDCFSIGQFVGVQFTPMSYQKPLLLEAQVRHLEAYDDQQGFLVGVEFLGLEASPEGRDVLHRLLEVIDEYEKMNAKSD